MKLMVGQSNFGYQVFLVIMFRFTFSCRQSVLIACVDCVLVAVVYMLCLLFIVIFVMCINSILLG